MFCGFCHRIVKTCFLHYVDFLVKKSCAIFRHLASFGVICLVWCTSTQRGKFVPDNKCLCHQSAIQYPTITFISLNFIHQVLLFSVYYCMCTVMYTLFVNTWIIIAYPLFYYVLFV